MRGRIVLLSAVMLLAATPLFAWGTDSDNDGIKDRKDQCAATPVGAKVDKVGCPVDSDTDGLFDGLDRCSRTPQGWPVDTMGCPSDTDRDSVVDAQDMCPSTMGGARVDSKGCPWDSDGDSVLEGLDLCAGTPSGYRVDDHGCPVDSDHDGVNEALDRCPETRHLETVDADGCRVKAPQLFSPGTDTVRLQGLSFEKNQVETPDASGAVLRDVAASLKDWPDIRVEIAVHTDRAGSAATNRERSQRRAEFVKNYLVTQGVDESRLEAKGYGEGGRVTERVVELKCIK